MTERATQSTATGVGGNQKNHLTGGPREPRAVQDCQHFERHAHFNRERIAGRAAHGKGSRHYSPLTVVAGDISRSTNAKALQLTGERGVADTESDVASFALKIYPEEGDGDRVGNNMPVFFVRWFDHCIKAGAAYGASVGEARGLKVPVAASSRLTEAAQPPVTAGFQRSSTLLSDLNYSVTLRTRKGDE